MPHRLFVTARSHQHCPSPDLTQSCSPQILIIHFACLLSQQLKVVGIYGEHDAMKADFALLEEALPRSQFVMIPNARHACYLDAPDLFNRELLRFLDNEVL